MPSPHARASAALLAGASATLQKNQRELSEMLGVSLRTVARWFARQSVPSPWHFEALAREAVARDPGLATELAVAAGTTLAAMGFSASTLAGGPASGPLSDALRVDCILCAAAAAMDASPNTVRPALLAAFARAKEVGMSVEAVLALLRAGVEAPTAKRSKAKRATASDPAG